MPDLLFVCTGNRCRSPVAEALARRALRERSIQAEVASAGMLEGGAGLPHETTRVLANRGIESGGRRSVQVTPELVATSTLILGMGREHVREIAVLDANAWRKTFTLKEAVRRANHIGSRGFAEQLDVLVARLGEGREPSELVGASAADDIEDPIGARYSEHERTAAIIDELVTELIDLAWPDGLG